MPLISFELFSGRSAYHRQSKWGQDLPLRPFFKKDGEVTDRLLLWQGLDVKVYERNGILSVTRYKGRFYKEELRLK